MSDCAFVCVCVCAVPPVCGCYGGRACVFCLNGVCSNSMDVLFVDTVGDIFPRTKAPHREGMHDKFNSPPLRYYI